MTERIDHAGEARRLISGAQRPPAGMTTEEVGITAEMAQVHATLALVEQQRIANLIAVSQMEGGPYKDINGWTRCVRDEDGFHLTDEDAQPYVVQQIREGLGL